MEAGRVRSNETRMKGTINNDNKMTDIYLPRKCDYTDQIITSKDHSSIQISVCDVYFYLLRSMKTEPSILENPALSLSQDLLDPLDKVMPLWTRFSEKRNLSDRTEPLFNAHFLVSTFTTIYILTFSIINFLKIFYKTCVLIMFLLSFYYF